MQLGGRSQKIESRCIFVIIAKMNSRVTALKHCFAGILEDVRPTVRT